MADGSTTIEYDEGRIRFESSNPYVNAGIGAAVVIVSSSVALAIARSTGQSTGDSVAGAFAKSGSSAFMRGLLRS